VGKFRVKLGDTEIEYEGEDSESKYQAALDWLNKTPQKERVKEDKAHKESEDTEVKSSKRGGIRSAVVSPKIDQLIEGGWFSEHRTIDDVMAELKRLVVPGADKTNVTNALKRRVGKTLETVMDNEVQVFWSKKKSGKPAE
jgi:hypothetical protein